jgi:subtilase family serine protease
MLEPLETRTLLAASLPAGWQATPIADPHFLSGFDSSASLPPAGLTSNQILSSFDYSGSSSPSGLTPNQIRGAYGLGTYSAGSGSLSNGNYVPGSLQNGISFGGINGDGRGQTIAIVDDYDDPNALGDLNAFSAYYGLPTLSNAGSSPSFQQLTEYGQPVSRDTTSANYVPKDPSGPWYATGNTDWELEESLDIEWAHVTAPMANIILFEASDPGDGLVTAVQTAAQTSGVVAISMSWGGNEFSGESSDDSTYFTTPSDHIGGSATIGGTDLAGGVTFLAAAGDYGPYLPSGYIEATYPAASPAIGTRRLAG